eukprot:2297693-Prymnesium_polylepis.1
MRHCIGTARHCMHCLAVHALPGSACSASQCLAVHAVPRSAYAVAVHAVPCSAYAVPCSAALPRSAYAVPCRSAYAVPRREATYVTTSAIRPTMCEITYSVTRRNSVRDIFGSSPRAGLARKTRPSRDLK